MAAYAELSGRLIRFEINVSGDPDSLDPYEFEIISGGVTDVAQEQYYLPVNQTVCNVVAHGRTVTYNFQGVLLMSSMPWTYLTPMMQVLNLYVGINRDGVTDRDGQFYDEQYHYSRYGVVTQIKHLFDTGTHQVFDVTIVADGSYYEPGGL